MLGREVIRIFHEAQRYYHGVTYSIDELIESVGPRWWPDAITNAIELDEALTNTKVSNAMISLAEKSNGKIPENYNVFIMALSDEIQSFSFKDFENVLDETIKDTTTIVKQVAVGYAGWQIALVLLPLVAIFLTRKK